MWWPSWYETSHSDVVLRQILAWRLTPETSQPWEKPPEVTSKSHIALKPWELRLNIDILGGKWVVHYRLALELRLSISPEWQRASKLNFLAIFRKREGAEVEHLQGTLKLRMNRHLSKQKMNLKEQLQQPSQSLICSLIVRKIENGN